MNFYLTTLHGQFQEWILLDINDKKSSWREAPCLRVAEWSDEIVSVSDDINDNGLPIILVSTSWLTGLMMEQFTINSWIQ